MATPSRIEIVLADDVKARVERRALERAQDVSEYVNARLREIFGLDDEIRDKVRRGREDIAAGRIVDDDKVDAWLIRRYISQYEPRAAAKVAARIRKTRDLLRRHPLAGHEGREPGTRETVVDKRYIVIHQVTEQAVEILGVVDGRRDRP
jgi:plasmid stabilization system protein ParE